MDVFRLFSIIITLAVVVGYVNHRFIKLHPTIAIMMGSFMMSLVLIIVNALGIADIGPYFQNVMTNIHFDQLLLKGMLSFLLFAGAMVLDVKYLRKYKWEILILSSVSTILSVFLVGIFSYYVLMLFGLNVSFIYCLLFGALISPTDPIAILATFKRLKASKISHILVAGESLFNDGVGIVCFVVVGKLALSAGAADVTPVSVFLLFLQEAVGGMLYGVLIGFISFWLIKPLKDSKMAILVTLATVTGGYTFANFLNVSGPLAMVVAGIFLSNYSSKFKIQDHIHSKIVNFWEIIDEVLNAVLFLLIGFEVLLIDILPTYLLAILVFIPMILIIRLVTVALPIGVFKMKKYYSAYIVSILTWGGLRGGLAVALALSIPPGEYRDLIVTLTYGVVAFSVLVQGISIHPLVKLANQKDAKV
jgi:monovalent cation:H+ antiporter, CPA1 family